MGLFRLIGDCVGFWRFKHWIVRGFVVLVSVRKIMDGVWLLQLPAGTRRVVVVLQGFCLGWFELRFDRMVSLSGWSRLAEGRWFQLDLVTDVSSTADREAYCLCSSVSKQVDFDDRPAWDGAFRFLVVVLS